MGETKTEAMTEFDAALSKVKASIYSGKLGEIIKKQYPDISDIKLVKSITAPEVSWEYFKMFLQTAINLRLDPFKKQIWCYHIDKSKAPVIFAGIHGVVAIAQRHDVFDGVETEWVKTDSGDMVIARAWRKDRRLPAVGIARDWRDNQHQAQWKKMPEYMLEKVAKARALREAFPEDLSDIYVEEEFTKPPKQVDAEISDPEPKTTIEDFKAATPEVKEEPKPETKPKKEKAEKDDAPVATVVEWKRRLKKENPDIGGKAAVSEATVLAEKVKITVAELDALTKEEFDALYQKHIIIGETK